MGAWIETSSLDNALKVISSHPVWVRGLKLAISDELSQANPVAPRVGAWIETTTEGVNLLSRSSRTPCGCVD